MTASETLIHGLETTIWVSLLTIIALLLRGPVTKRFGSRAAMLLWALPGARLIVPTLPERVLVQSVPESAPSAPATWTAAPIPAEASAPLPVSLASPEPVSAGLPMFSMPSTETMAIFVMCLWFLGVLVAVALCAMRSSRWRQTLLNEARPMPQATAKMADRMAERAGTQKPFTLIISAAADTPQIMGFRKPLLALPKDFGDRYSPEEQEMALLHELTHLKRNDLSLLIISELAFALQWFNPLTKHARRAIRADQEAACDEAVRDLGVNTKSYAALLVKAVSLGRPGPALTLDHDLKERIIRMQNPTGTPIKRLAFMLAAGASALAVAGFTASRTEVLVFDEHPHEEHVEELEPSGEESEAELLKRLRKHGIIADGDEVIIEFDLEGDIEELDDLSPELRESILQESKPAVRAKHIVIKGLTKDSEHEIIALDEVGLNSDIERRLKLGDGGTKVIVLSDDGEILSENVLSGQLAEARVEARARVKERADSDEALRIVRRMAAERERMEAERERMAAEHKADGFVKFNWVGEGDKEAFFSTEEDFSFDFSFEMDEKSEKSGRKYWVGKKKQSLVLLNDPFAEIQTRQPEAPNIKPPKMKIPKITERKTDEGTWMFIPNVEETEEFEEAMEAFSDQMEEFGEAMEAWGEEMGEVGEAIGELAEECDEHIQESDEPILMKERADNGTTVKALCASGGEERLSSSEITEFLKKKGVSRQEMKTYLDNVNG